MSIPIYYDTPSGISISSTRQTYYPTKHFLFNCKYQLPKSLIKFIFVELNKIIFSAAGPLVRHKVLFISSFRKAVAFNNI